MGTDTLTEPSPTLIVPFTPVVSVGEYRTASEQVVPGGNAAAQVLPEIATWATPVPENVTVSGRVAEPPMLEMMTVWLGEIWFTGTEPKDTRDGLGERVGAARAVPER
jgi:hypothetical protein